MSLIEEQFEKLKAETKTEMAELRRLPDGSHLIVLPGISLLQGWSKPQTTIRFVAPPAFPHAQPDCFWADQDLRLSNGGMPQNCGITAPPNTNEQLLWFSWHVGQWSPNRDTLLTYFNVIRNRLKEIR